MVNERKVSGKMKTPTQFAQLALQLVSFVAWLKGD